MPVDDLPTKELSIRRAQAGRSGETRLRSIAKAVSWRVVGRLDTLVLSSLFTGNVLIVGSIASTETVTKAVLYYLHERGWSPVSLGRARS